MEDKETIERLMARITLKKMEQQEKTKQTQQHESEFAHHETQFVKHTEEWKRRKEQWDVQQKEREQLKDDWKGLVENQRFVAGSLTLGLGLLLGSISEKDVALTIHHISLANDEVELSQGLRAYYSMAEQYSYLLKQEDIKEQEWLKEVSEMQTTLSKALKQMSQSINDAEYSEDDVKKYQDECSRIIKESEEKSATINNEINEFVEKARKIVDEVTEREKALSNLTARLEDCQKKVDECIKELKSLSQKYSTATVVAGGGWGAVIGGIFGALGGPPGAIVGAAIGSAVGLVGSATVDANTAGKEREQLNKNEERLNKIKIDLNAVLETCNKEIGHLKQILSKKELTAIYHTSESVHYTLAKDEIKVPFLYHQMLECGYRGLEYYIADHNISLRIPEGIVAKSETVRFEIAVAMNGPFTFPNNTRPISPIVWLCLMDESVKLQKPFRLILPHSLTGLTVEEMEHHQISFAKADHRLLSPQSTYYDFQTVPNQPLFATSGSKSYGVLSTDHCCYYCLKAGMSPELIKDTSHCLVRTEVPLQSEIHFSVIYYLETCLRAVEEQLDPRKYKTRYYSFKFKANKDNSEQFLKLIVPDEHDSCVIERDPIQIMASDVDFWQDSSLKLKQNRGEYPPKIVLTVSSKVSNYSKFTLPINFEGCSPANKLDMELAFPLQGSTLPMSSSTSTCKAGSQSRDILSEKPTLREAFVITFPLAAKWKNIGVVLNINSYVLDKIEHDEKIADNCLRAMLDEWLKQTDSPSWKALQCAVKPYDSKLADEIPRSIPCALD